MYPFLMYRAWEQQIKLNNELPVTLQETVDEENNGLCWSLIILIILVAVTLIWVLLTNLIL